MTVKHLFLCRHGQTDWNKEGRIQGHLDIELNNEGRQQARDLVPFLKEQQLGMIYTSPLIRAFETAKIIADELIVPLQKYQGLVEANVGDASGLCKHDFNRVFGVGTLLKWGSMDAAHDNFCFPNGETNKQVRDMAFVTIRKLANHSASDRIGIVSHGFLLKQFLIGLNRLKRISNASVIYVTYDTMLNRFNFVYHFEETKSLQLVDQLNS